MSQSPSCALLMMCNITRQLLREAGGHGGIVSKIERAEALDCIEEIIDASDVIMVARGDLGVEIGDAELPAAQKHLISTARQMNCVVITATQMMESMIQNPIPTRAEVFDVANAVMDGTDAVMLSAEIGCRQVPGQGRRGHGPGLQRGGKAIADPPVATIGCTRCSDGSTRRSRCRRCIPRITSGWRRSRR